MVATSVIRKAMPFVTCLAMGAMATDGHAQDAIPSWTIAQLEHAIDQGHLGKIDALAAEQHKRVAYRKRFDGKELGDPVDIRSAGKSLTALAVGAAIADGKLAGVDVKVWPYLRARRGEPFDSITVRDLLTMASALDCSDAQKQSPGQEEKMYRARSWRAFALALPARDFVRDQDGFGPWSYCTAGVFLLGQVVEEAVGEPFDRYVQRRLLDPLTISSVRWRRSPSGEVQSGGQLRIADVDLLKLGRLVLDKGVWNGSQIVPADWIADMLTPHRQVGANVRYGYLWWAIPLRAPNGYEAAWMMQGNGGNIIALIPAYDAVLVVQAENYNRPEADRNAYTALTTMIGMLDKPVE